MLYIEIRAGEGGDDAAGFAGELSDAVTAWAARNAITVEHEPSALVLSGARGEFL